MSISQNAAPRTTLARSTPSIRGSDPPFGGCDLAPGRKPRRPIRLPEEALHRRSVCASEHRGLRSRCATTDTRGRGFELLDLSFELQHTQCRAGRGLDVAFA